MFGANTAFASRSICRTDPVVVLSDGTIFDLSASISTTPDNIDHVDYTIHAPAGVKATSIVYTDLFLVNEKVYVVNDSPARTYSTETTVYLDDQSAVWAQAMAVKGLAVKTVDGVTGSPMVINFGTSLFK